MEYQLEITYTEEIITKAAKCFWSKRFGNDFYISSFALIIAIVFVFIFNNFNWLGGVISAVAGIYFITVFGGYIYYQKLAQKKFNSFTNNTVNWSFNDAGLTTMSSLGNSQIHWLAIPKYYLSKDFLLLIFNDNSYSTLPISYLNNQVIEFITSNIKKAGGNVM